MIQFRRGTASAASTANEVLAAGQPFVETDTSKLKIGDGSTAFNDLPYIGGSGGKKYATVVVGTSTAGYTADQVDFLCDGVDDQVEINAALQRTVVSSDAITVVYVLPGTYNLSQTVEFPTASSGSNYQCILSGSGRKSTKFVSTVAPTSGLSTDGTNSSSMNNSCAISMPTNSCSIMNIGLSSDTAPWLIKLQGSSNDSLCAILQNMQLSSSLNGIGTYRMYNLKIQDTSIICSGVGIASFSNGRNVLVDNCVIDSFESVGVIASARPFILQNSYITGQGNEAVSSTIGVDVTGYEAIVTGNYINSGTGIQLSGGTCRCVSNRIYARYMISITGGEHHMVASNTGTGTGGIAGSSQFYNGVFLTVNNSHQITVVNNSVFQLESFASIGENCHHNTITSNCAHQTNNFMTINGNYNVIESNVSYNEYFQPTSGIDEYSIRITGSNNVVSCNILDFSDPIEDSGSNNSTTGNVISVQH